MQPFKDDNKKGYALISLSDTHINSTTALCVPRFNLDDGGTYYASPAQKELYKFFLEFAEDVKRITEGYTRIVVFNGDIGELDSKNRSHQLITRNRATVLRMTVETLNPVIILADAIVVVRGTPAHSGKSSWLEEALARDLEGLTIPFSDEIYSHYHYKQRIGNVRFDIAHHARMGGMRHTAKTYAVRLAQETMDKYRDRNELPPHVIIRSHQHRRADSGHNWPSFAIYTPSWQLPNEYIYRIGKENDYPDIGGDIFLCTNNTQEHVNKNCIIYPDFIWYPLSYKPKKVGKRWKPLKI